jgi:hypothetical protein
MNPFLKETGDSTGFEYSNISSHYIDPNVVLGED